MMGNKEKEDERRRMLADKREGACDRDKWLAAPYTGFQVIFLPYMSHSSFVLQGVLLIR